MTTDMPEVIYAMTGCAYADDGQAWYVGDKINDDDTKYIRTDKHEELKAIAEKMACRLFEMVEASRTGNIDSPEIGDAETGYHKWHEEWEYCAYKILTEYNKYKGE